MDTSTMLATLAIVKTLPETSTAEAVAAANRAEAAAESVEESVQEIEELTEDVADLKNAVVKLPQDVLTDELESDLDIIDADGNVLARFSNGHFATKYFNSATIPNFSFVVHASGDSSDRTQDIINALQNYDVVDLSAGDFYVSSQITIPAGTTLRGHGDCTNIIVSVNNIASVFALSNKSTISDLAIHGPLVDKPSTFSGMHAITIQTQSSENRVLNVSIDGFPGAGIYSIYTYVNNHNSNIISNCRFNFCGCGIYIGQRSEAFVASNCVVLYSYIGIHCIGGNNRIIANLIRGCTTGIDMTSNSTSDNDGHSVFSADIVIHNTNSIVINTIENGSVFDGCTIFDGTISVVNSTGVMFIGCEIGSLRSIAATGTSAGARMSNCIFNAMTPSVVSGFALNNCTLLDGTAFETE